MKRQIRHGVFETNSSSTHSITMMMKDDYNRWSREDLYLYKGSGWGWDFGKPQFNKLYTRDEVIEFLRTNKYWDFSKEECLKDEEEFYSMCIDDDFIPSDYQSDYLESYYSEFITPSGDTIVAFGEYGHD